jgi:hypothetical protein
MILSLEMSTQILRWHTVILSLEMNMYDPGESMWIPETKVWE